MPRLSVPMEGSQKELHNPELLVSPLTAKEATVSSKIEGTQSTVSDIFMYEAGGKTKHSDVSEVSNYRKAMSFAIEEMSKGRNITSHLIKTLHSLLLKDVRHKGVLGDFRQSQVWLGPEGAPIEKATYVPPENIKVPEYMENLFDYVKDGK